MGSGDWFKTIISRKKSKQGQPKQVKGANSERSNGFKWKNQTQKVSNKLYHGTASGNPGEFDVSIENRAATRIQTAFRGFRARKTLRHLKGIKRLQFLTQGRSVKNQASVTLCSLQSWSKIQTQIRARRACMVTDGRIKQKKQDNQLKLEAKLHDLEVEWCGSSETMEEILARMQQREEAAIKRERTMAYAFSHQWRANSNPNLGYEFGKGTWGWSWMERWIAARPWEIRLPTQSISPTKTKSKAASKGGKDTESSAQGISNGKVATMSSSSPPTDEKTATQEPAAPPQSKTKNATIKQETHVVPSQSN